MRYMESTSFILVPVQNNCKKFISNLKYVKLMDKHNVGLAGRMISEIFHMTKDTTNREVFGIFRYRPIFVEKEKGSFRAFCR